ncbi:hypothetical protein V1288_002876 [Bradyrhizobium sp. AZCC 2176]
MILEVGLQRAATATTPVMPGLVPGIHVFFALNWKKQDVDGRVKPGHDETG